MLARSLRPLLTLIVPALALLLVAPSCSDDSGSGPPSGSGGSGGDDDAGEDEQPAPDPGVCHKLCCADTDCSSGETCQAFNSAWGTLGTCSGTGWGDADGGTADAGASTPLPADCWTLNEPSCNPITNEECAPPDVCDLGGWDEEDPSVDPYVDCLAGEALQGPGEDCDNVEGPFCIPGFHCVSNNP